MSVLMAATAAVLFSLGTYLLLQRKLSRIIIGIGLLGHGANVLFVNAGRLVAQKDHATLLRAFALVLQRMPARLLILGNGPLQPELEQLAAELGIAEHVRFAGFVVNPLPYFRRAAAFVLSSRYEGFGNVLIEAMACGTPVITTDCPYGPGEIVDNGRFGRLAEPQNPQSLAAAMISIASMTPEQRRGMGRAGRAFMERCFAETVVHRSYRDALSEALAKGL